MALPAPARRVPSPPHAAEVSRHAASADEPMLWTRERYDRAVDAGILTPGDRVELLDGLIVAKMSQNRPHRISVIVAAEALRSAFSPGAHVQEEKPIALSDLSEPEPDIAVVKGSPRDYDPHPDPEALLLVVEVADSSLFTDRLRKAGMYADAGVAEFWLVNLRDRTLEVYRDPAGGAYRSKATYDPSASVSPVNAPDASIPVSDLLP